MEVFGIAPHGLIFATMCKILWRTLVCFVHYIFMALPPSIDLKHQFLGLRPRRRPRLGHKLGPGKGQGAGVSLGPDLDLHPGVGLGLGLGLCLGLGSGLGLGMSPGLSKA